MPNAKLLKGCAYIVSKLKENGIIENSGITQTIYFGNNELEKEQLTAFEQILQMLGLMQDIRVTLIPLFGKNLFLFYQLQLQVVISMFV